MREINLTRLFTKTASPVMVILAAGAFIFGDVQSALYAMIAAGVFAIWEVSYELNQKS
jgi:hypothetical protein